MRDTDFQQGEVISYFPAGSKNWLISRTLICPTPRGELDSFITTWSSAVCGKYILREQHLLGAMCKSHVRVRLDPKHQEPS